MANNSVSKIQWNDKLQGLFDEADNASLINIPLSDIDSFPNHPFKVQDDEAMQELAESIKEHGVLTPALARQKDDGRYELISGHRRKRACELAGLTSMPVTIQDIDRETATIRMVDSNLQREFILPSEKALAYKMRLDAMNRQGQRTDLTSTPMVQKLSVEKIGDKSGESREQIRRYIRLTELIPELLKMVDEKSMAFRPAVELSYLPKEQQKMLFDTIECEDCTPSLAQAIKMKQFSQNERLNEDVIFSILSEAKPNQKEQFKIPREKISKFFPEGTKAEKIEETIIKALELYRKRQREQQER
ncbi:MAG: ParB/RepB/Spo0J family partition protein [Eubacteriales bacterium]|nr:ParB/RepB/Spo0J family partition protein [Eubacteriales bacterium]